MPVYCDSNRFLSGINNCYIPALKNKDRYLILFGGAGSGKSVFAVQKMLLRIVYEGNHRILVLRKVARANRLSTFALIKDMIKKWNLDFDLRINNTLQEIHLPFFKSSIYFTGLDDVEKLKSIANITIIWIEEASELNENDFDQINLRLRGETDFYKQIIVTFNPIDESHWLKRKFFDEHFLGSFALKTTYLDNQFIDNDYKQVLENNFLTNENYYRIYVKGEWGRISNGGEFYKHFSMQKHVIKNLDYDSDLPLHITFDFNVLPFVACTIWQIEKKQDKWAAYCIDEICLQPPKNRTENVCLEIQKRYPNYKHNCLIYGDPSGKNESAMTQQGVNNFTIIQDRLGLSGNAFRVMKSSFGVKMRGLFIDSILYGNTEIDIFINANCKKTIEEFLYLQEGQDGLKLKKRVKDATTGASYEERGHIADSLEYLFVVAFYKEFAKFFTSNSKVQSQINYISKKQMY